MRAFEILEYPMHEMRRLIRLVETSHHHKIIDTVTKSDEFKRWFAGSKVVDAQGKPLVVYHGTTGHFDAFSDEDAPHRGGLISFFSTSPKFASDYATTHEGAQVIPCFLRIEDPFDYRTDWEQAHWFWEETGGIFDVYEINRILMGLGEPIQNIDEPGHVLSEKQFVNAVKAGSWDALEAPEFVTWLHEGGTDGIITREGGAINFGIFEPTQVKSIFSFTFDPDNPNMSESK